MRQGGRPALPGYLVVSGRATAARQVAQRGVHCCRRSRGAERGRAGGTGALPATRCGAGELLVAVALCTESRDGSVVTAARLATAAGHSDSGAGCEATAVRGHLWGCPRARECYVHSPPPWAIDVRGGCPVPGADFPWVRIVPTTPVGPGGQQSAPVVSLSLFAGWQLPRPCFNSHA